ncbi:MAG: hypothetical protein ACI9VI_003179 [Candidatus Azotimanducaceae bacterium]|jgi:hypothetical protein
MSRPVLFYFEDATTKLYAALSDLVDILSLYKPQERLMPGKISFLGELMLTAPAGLFELACAQFPNRWIVLPGSENIFVRTRLSSI